MLIQRPILQELIGIFVYPIQFTTYSIYQEKIFIFSMFRCFYAKKSIILRMAVMNIHTVIMFNKVNCEQEN